MSIENKKWYSKKWLLILLLFTIPPVAIYGVFKRDSKIWKKILFTIGALFTSFCLLGYTLGTLFPTNHYDIGTKYLNKNEYSEAINSYQRVEKSDKNFESTQRKIKLAQFKIDSTRNSIREILENRKRDSLIKLEAIDSFNKEFSKSVLKGWNNTYVKSYDISENNDSIIFIMSSRSTEGNWSSGAKLNERIYQKRYDSIFKSKFPKDSSIVKIVYSPNKEQLSKNEIVNRRNHLVNRQFATFNGSNAFLVNFIKDRMNNPKSFKHIETTYKDKGSYIDVYMSFRGTNTRGVLVLNRIKAKMSINGEIISAKYL
jgi:hypothetical protein